jgi:hypothetical protein
LLTQRRLNPLIGAAAVSIVVASLAAVAAITGVLPISKANQVAPSPPRHSTTRNPPHKRRRSRDTNVCARLDHTPAGL